MTNTVRAAVFAVMLASLTAACASEVDKCVSAGMAVFDEANPSGVRETHAERYRFRDGETDQIFVMYGYSRPLDFAIKEEMRRMQDPRAVPQVAPPPRTTTRAEQELDFRIRRCRP